MSADLPTLLTPFKRELAELQGRYSAGTLSKTQLDRQTAVLERRLLDLLLHDTEANPGTVAARKASWRLLTGIALAIVLIAGVGYWFKGTPTQGAQQEQGAGEGEGSGEPNAAQIIAMVDKLAERLKQDPSDGEGWAMLARSYSVMERNAEALDAYARAIALRKDDPSLLVDYADALAVKNNNSLAGEPMKLIDQALKIDPANLKGLALAGTEAFVRQDFAQAVRYWSEVEKVGPPDNALVQRVTSSLAEARSRAGLPAAPAPQLAPPPSPVAAPGPAPGPAPVVAPAAQGALKGAAASVGGTVTLSPALLAQTSPQDTVFIFARPANGGRMPLAAQRIQVKDLPYRFMLDDSKSMSSGMPLSSSPQVVLGARISKSGDAIPQPGDLSGQVGPVALGTQGIALEINEVRKP
jgi:cytochrome c-type biogenesis protein CcmH